MPSAECMDNLSTMDLLTLFFIIFLIYALLLPQFQLWNHRRSRFGKIKTMENRWGSKVLTMVHKKEALSIFGLPIYQSIDMEDAEELLRGIRSAGTKPIDVILHTPGGQLLPSIQIARALKNHKARTRAIVPHHAMSGGTIIALACDEIVMDPEAMIGPIDPQVGDMIRGAYPAHSWIYATDMKGKNADDVSFIMRHISEKALRLMQDLVQELLGDKMDKEDVQEISDKLLGGEYIHSQPISATNAKDLGLPVTIDLPQEVHEYMTTFRSVKTNVEYLR
ncbi:MAG: SDH family Clp fold serine proteinase [Methanotrichaceae archaeon]